MEFIIVQIKDNPTAHAAVLLDGQRNGTTGRLITLGNPGWVNVSVDFSNAQAQDVNVKNTTALHPMTIEIEC